MYRDEPENPMGIVGSIIAGIIYVAAAAICALCLTTNIVADVLGNFIKSLDTTSLQALVRLYGYMILALLPSAILFVISKTPLEMTKLARILLWIVAVLGMAGLIWLFFIVSDKPEYTELLGNTGKDLYGILWLRCSLIVAAVGLVSVNLMSNFSPDFNTSNPFASFLELVWTFSSEGRLGYILFILLNFVTLPWAFLILPIAGVVAFTGITTLTIYCNMTD